MRTQLQHLDTLLGGGRRHEAEQILASVLHVSPGRLYLNAPEPTEAEWALAQAMARRRAAGEPLQYVIGWLPFLGARISVGPGVLVPRPETEGLTEAALKAWHDLGSPTPRVAIDVGTGSGCIAIALVVADSSLRVLGLESSDAALHWAGRNAVENGAGTSVELYRSDFFSALPELGFPRHGASLIISNPPYIALGEAARLPRDIVEHEPAEALFSGESGLDHLRRIIAEAPDWLSSPGLLALEIGETQTDDVVEMLRESRAYSRWDVRPDLARRPRIVMAWK